MVIVLYHDKYHTNGFISDELIRQITINCAERGLLLLRVRDEARMRISAFETLYESSIAYGIRKALMAEQKKTELDNKINELKVTQSDLKSQVENLKKSIENTQIRALEKREAEEKAHMEEVKFYKIVALVVLHICAHVNIYKLFTLPTDFYHHISINLSIYE